MKPPVRALVALGVTMALATAACGSSSKSASSGTSTTSAAPATTVSPQLQGSLTVFAAASLTAAFDDIKAELKTAAPNLSLTDNYAGSQALVQQIQNGAPADVFASADTANMNKLVSSSMVETPQIFARNALEIAVAPGNPKGIHGLSDLSRSDLKVVLCDPSVPAGNYARQALSMAGVTVHPVSNPLDVKAAVMTVTSGEADATIAYVTDVTAAGSAATGVQIPANQNVIATYPIAVVKSTKNLPAAQAYVSYVVSGPGQKALQARGFMAP
jgi:molybdate transport system substrate-binding protein